jgi:hypothetical protein
MTDQRRLYVILRDYPVTAFPNTIFDKDQETTWVTVGVEWHTPEKEGTP